MRRVRLTLIGGLSGAIAAVALHFLPASGERAWRRVEVVSLGASESARGIADSATRAALVREPIGPPPAAEARLAPERPAGYAAERGGAVDRPGGSDPAERAPGLLWLDRRLFASAADATYLVRTDLSTDVAQAVLAALGRLAVVLDERFGAPDPRTADGRLPVYVYSRREVYERGPVQREVPWPRGRRGFFDGRGGAHVEVGTSAGEFLAVLTHEAVHQWQAATLGLRGPRWFVEGVAHDLEWLSSRDAAGDLRPWVERIDPQEPSAALDLPARAVSETLLIDCLAVLDRGGADWRAVLSGGDAAGLDEAAARALGCFLVRFLRTSSDPEIAAWYPAFERALSAGRPPPPAPPALLQADLGSRLRAFALSMRPTTRIELRIEPPVRLGEGVSWPEGVVGSEAAIRTADGSELVWPMVSIPDDGAGLRVSFRTLGFDPGERLGAGVLDAAGNLVAAWLLDAEGHDLAIETRRGSGVLEVRRVRASARVRRTFVLDFTLAPDQGVEVRRNGILLFRGRCPDSGSGASLAIVFRAGDRSRFETGTTLTDVILDPDGVATAQRGSDG